MSLEQHDRESFRAAPGPRRTCESERDRARAVTGVAAIGVAALTALGACGVDYAFSAPPQPDAPTQPAAAPPTWYADIGPLLHENCTGCHQPNGIAPFSLVGIDDARTHLAEAIAAVTNGIMPPYYADADPDCTPTRAWRDDPRLTPAQIALLRGWLGDAGDPAPLPDPPSTTLANPTLTLVPTQPYVASGLRDEFACYIYDPGFTQTEYMTAFQVRPELPWLVHHGDFAIVAPEQAAQYRALGLGIPTPCQTVPGVPIHDWAPGNAPITLPDGIAVPIAPGSLIAIQFHYHPNGTAGSDATALDLRLTETPPTWHYRLYSLGNVDTPPILLPDPDDPPSGPVFMVPANRSDHVETMQFTIGNDVVDGDTRFVEATPHAHLTATHLRATIDRVNGEHECLTTGRWNFDWQRTYGYGGPLDELPKLAAGDVVTVTCHYDNTIENPFVQRLLTDEGLVAPKNIWLGSNTFDEMCVQNFGIATVPIALPTSVR